MMNRVEATGAVMRTKRATSLSTCARCIVYGTLVAQAMTKRRATIIFT